jgi:hypothetical protein
MRRLSLAPYKRTLFGDALRVGVLAAMATVARPGAFLDSWLAFLVPSFASGVFLATIASAPLPRIAELQHGRASIAISAAILTPIPDFGLRRRFGVLGIALARTFILGITTAALRSAVFRKRPRVLAAVGTL